MSFVYVLLSLYFDFKLSVVNILVGFMGEGRTGFFEGVYGRDGFWGYCFLRLISTCRYSLNKL